MSATGSSVRPGITRRFSSSRSSVRTLTGTWLRIGAICLGIALTGCGGGGSDPATGTTPDRQTPANTLLSAPSDQDAYRFLVQTTFGPTSEELSRVKAIGFDNWIEEQYAMRLQHKHLQTVEASSAARGVRSDAFDVSYSWWTHAVRDPAQLRQRVAFALSEIFVVSTLTLDKGRTVGSYLDMLTEMADANYRDLLEAVALHPAMGQYLSHMSNRKGDPTSGRVPDENFAREVMQLFSIGLHELDDSGHLKLYDNKPIETYSGDDIKGLARVFTGFSWHRPADKLGLAWWQCFWHTSSCNEDIQDITPMSAYAQEHETGAKSFLLRSGETYVIAPQSPASPLESLRLALDRLATHPNTAPFISKQLIQRLVTSNPSPDYVRDITGVFRRTNGNLKAVVKAILLHEQARNPTDLHTFGKLREPVIRFAHLMRTLPHSSGTYNTQTAAGRIGYYQFDDTSDPGTGLGQAPMRAPSVFNFFRPGYTPPQSELASANLVAPEMQITNETSVLGYANYVAFALASGWGRWNSSIQRMDMQFDLSAWHSQADQPSTLIDTLALRLMGRHLPDAARQEAIAALTAMPVSNSTQRRQRVQAAILLIAVSPEFVIQQ